LCRLAGDEQIPETLVQGRAWRDSDQRKAGSRSALLAKPDRVDGQGDSLRPGRFAGRDRTSRSQLDEDAGLTRARAKPRCQEQQMAMNDVIVVLAHGGWADRSSWALVITGLAASGASRRHHP